MDKMLSQVYLVVCELYLSFYFVYAKHEQFEGHSLYEVKVKNIEDTTIIHNLVTHLYLDVWSHVRPGRSGLILVPKEDKEVFEIALNAGGINYEIKVANIRELLLTEDRLLRAAAARNRRERHNKDEFKISFDMVYTYDEINSYLEYVANHFPYARKVNGGYSFEGRPINYLKISTTNFENKNKPVVMLQSLVHSREWVTSPVTLYIIHNLVVDNIAPDLINNIDWIIVPVVNPDGYIYSHQSNRLWRKNRRTGLSGMCNGVDLNRNFNVNWGTASSSDPCTVDFHGKGPMSEPETRVITDIIMMYKSRMVLYFDIHSFASVILYGYGNGTLPRNQNTLHQVGVMMAHAIDKVKAPRNPYYTVGNILSILYDVSGCASDFAQAVGIPLSFSYELPAYRSRGPGASGFLVDSESISQTSFETWEGIAIAARYVLNKVKLNKAHTYRFIY